jgi:hypothetical protein
MKSVEHWILHHLLSVKVKHRREREINKNGALPTKSADIKIENEAVWRAFQILFTANIFS